MAGGEALKIVTAAGGEAPKIVTAAGGSTLRMTGLFAVAHASLDRYRSVWFRHGRGSSKIDVVVAASTGEASGRGRGEEVRKVRLLRVLRLLSFFSWHIPRGFRPRG